MSLSFDQETHRYYWNGEWVPNVTLVLKPLTDYRMVAPEALEIARQKGVAVHKMVELHASGQDYDIPAWMEPVHAWWLRFMSESGLEIIESERRVYHPKIQYAGTLDLKVRMRGMEGVGIIDVKRSFLQTPAIRLQLAAYMAADRATSDTPATWVGALKLREDQPYRFQPFVGKEYAGDFSMFCVALTHYRSGEILKTWKESQ